MFNKLFTPPSAVVIATKELEDSKRDLLVYQSRAEHSTKMVEYYTGVVKRLETYIKSNTKTASITDVEQFKAQR